MVKSLNRAAMLAIIPLMAFAITAMTKGNAGGRVVAPSPGVLVVANLREESLSFLTLPAGTTRTLALSGAPHELAIANGRLYVTLPHRELVLELDPVAPGVLRSVSLDGEPHGLAVAGGELLTTLDRGGSVVRLGRSSLEEVARARLGDTPHAVAADTSGTYVTVSRENRVVRIEGGEASATGPIPESVALTGRYVVTADAGGSLSVFEKGSLTFFGRMHLDGGPIRVITVEGDTVAVALNTRAEVAIIDLARWKVIKRIGVLPRPDGLCLSPDGEHLAVVSNATNTVQLYGTGSWRAAGIYATGLGPGACSWLAER